MRKLLFVALFFVYSSVHALPEWLVPSPVTIAIQVGKWILAKDNQEEVYYVRVQAKGTTESEARTEAFRLAVDQAVGSLLVSESEIQNGNVARHDVINYSSGYVYDFEYVNILRTPGEVTLQVDVYVRKSMIAERILVHGKSQGDLHGGKIAEAFKSIQQEQQTGDALLNAVLGDFPHKAIQVSNSKIEYINPNRQPTLTVDFRVQWRAKYLEALNEALQNTMHPVSVKSLRENGVVMYDNGCFWDCYDAFSTDPDRFTVFYNGLQENSSPMVEMLLIDVNQNIVFRKCYALMHNLYHYRTNWTFLISNNASYNNKIMLNLSNFDINKLDKVELQVRSIKDCNL